MSVVLAAPSGMGAVAEKVTEVVTRLEEEKRRIEETLVARQRIGCDDAKHLRNVYRAIEEILPSLAEVQLELKEEQTKLVPA